MVWLARGQAAVILVQEDSNGLLLQGERLKLNLNKYILSIGTVRLWNVRLKKGKLEYSSLEMLKKEKKIYLNVGLLKGRKMD